MNYTKGDDDPIDITELSEKNYGKQIKKIF